SVPSIPEMYTLSLHDALPIYSTPELTFRFQYFAIRKMHLAMRANALVIFPGGFGTLDEMFEILTLKQTAKISQIPILLFDHSYRSEEHTSELQSRFDIVCRLL